MSVYDVPGCPCVSNAKVYGLDESILRAKYPMSTRVETLTTELTKGIKALATSPHGAGHDQWLTGVIVQFDLTFSNKAWVEAERYHFLDFISSQSTMHRIARFNLNNVYNPYVDFRIVEVMKEKVQKYNDMSPDNPEREPLYLEILYSNPAGCLITAGMTTNYRQLKTIYAQRKDHRLPEWRQFCTWMKEKLPYSDLITGTENGETAKNE